MLNQSIQITCIHIRNAGAIAIGCLIGLVNKLGVFLQYWGLRERNYGPTGLGDRLLTSDPPARWLKRLQRQRHWHGQLSYLQPHWRAQQS